MRISILLVASYNPYFLPTIKQLLYAQLIRSFSIWLKLLLDNWALRHTLLAIKNKQIKILNLIHVLEIQALFHLMYLVFDKYDLV